MGKADRIREERQTRLVEASANQPKQKQMSPKLKRILISVLCVVLVVAMVAVVIINTRRTSGTAMKHADAITFNGKNYKATDVSFYYNVFKNQYASYDQQIYSAYGFHIYNVDFTKSLFEQTYDKDTGLSWGDYLLDQAVDTFYNYLALEAAGKAAGYVLPEEAYAAIDETVAGMESSAKTNGVSVEYLLKANYGTGITMEKFREFAEREAYASYYGKSIRDGFEVTQSDIDTHYNDNKNDFDVVNYRSFVLKVELPEHLDADGKVYSDDKTKAEDAEVIAEKLAELKKRLDAVNSEDGFNKLAEELTRSTDKDGKEVAGVTPEDTLKEGASYSSLSEDLQKWMFDADRKAGDTNIIENSSSLTAYYFLERSDRSELARSVRHILLKSDEEDETVKAKAEEILNQWLAGDKTAESFGELAKEHSEDAGSKDNGGLYEDVGRGTMVAEFDEWLFDADRKPGDTGIVFTEDFGYHIMYYVGETRPYRDVLVEDAIRSERYTDYTESLKTTYPLTRIEDGLSKIK
ncbi:MAG: peptidylprolyl isomerase [Eubacteriales bacterium]|nr:peptidylprolyl isomerase [Eubacteriales bacterium]